jgi:hypothetical protein
VAARSSDGPRTSQSTHPNTSSKSLGHNLFSIPVHQVFQHTSDTSTENITYPVGGFGISLRQLPRTIFVDRRSNIIIINRRFGSGHFMHTISTIKNAPECLVGIARLKGPRKAVRSHICRFPGLGIVAQPKRGALSVGCLLFPGSSQGFLPPSNTAVPLHVEAFLGSFVRCG